MLRAIAAHLTTAGKVAIAYQEVVKYFHVDFIYFFAN